MKRRWSALACSILACAGSAFGCADDDAGRFGPDGTPLAEYRIEPGPALNLSTDAVTLSVNESLKLVATHSDENGETSDVSAEAHWSSENPSIAWVQHGTVLGVYPGLTKLSVSYKGISTRVSVAITTQSLEAIEVVPSELEVPKGLSTQVRAFGTFRQDARREITGLVRWASSDAEIAVVNGNNVQARGMGEASIQASLNDITAAATVRVTSPRLLELAIVQQSESMTVGTSQQLRARGTFSDEQNVDVTDLADWSSDDSNLASVSENGLISARSSGDVGVWARYLDKSAQVSVSISE
ncbi:MAG TPA: Ig-like domain-containing protein [Polyangiales bacterium]|nr:Ig-like domain-containing protein [Polyangiales bacterium]